jgi:hypothetical protein
LRPFRARNVALFLPSWSPQEKVAAYAVFAHMPYYLAQIREEAGLADDILDLVLRPDGLLHNEARLLLNQELPDASVLLGVACHRRRSGQRLTDRSADWHLRRDVPGGPDARHVAQSLAGRA